MFLEANRVLYVDTEHPHGEFGTTLRVDPMDRFSLDPAGIEFESRETGERFFVPWGEIHRIRQPITGDDYSDDKQQSGGQARHARGKRTGNAS